MREIRTQDSGTAAALKAMTACRKALSSGAIARRGAGASAQRWEAKGERSNARQCAERRCRAKEAGPYRTRWPAKRNSCAFRLNPHRRRASPRRRMAQPIPCRRAKRYLRSAVEEEGKRRRGSHKRRRSTRRSGRSRPPPRESSQTTGRQGTRETRGETREATAARSRLPRLQIAPSFASVFASLRGDKTQGPDHRADFSLTTTAVSATVPWRSTPIYSSKASTQNQAKTRRAGRCAVLRPKA